MKQLPVRWEGLIGFVGKLEVGRVQRHSPTPGTDVDMWVSMLNDFGLSPLGTYKSDDMTVTLNLVKTGKRMIEDNWRKIEKLMHS